MNRHSEIVTTGQLSIETYVGRSTGPMTGLVLDDLRDDIAHVIDQLGRGPAVVLGHAFGNFVALRLRI